MIDSAEDEAFKELEQRTMWRKQAVLQAIRDENERLQMYSDQKLHRSEVIEEVAQHIEKMTGFGKDTINSFAIYIRGLK